ncbi:hypothetical protein AB3G45_24335 [Shinella sp. S4-D37]|jgi:hypothetical protein|uniref:hypothetical protein n=1 Tax=Shinella sp. S4-D37 TaxID=3161999 RepID=UPI003466BE47
MTVDRHTFYRHADGRPMTSQEQFVLLLEIGNLDYNAAAEITRVSPATILTYRKPSMKSRQVSQAILRPLEKHVFDRLTEIAGRAGYDLKPKKVA